ncbi:hypothetical protein LZ31DRAFT_255066 [Colletotrichum somersetense]|nr:hypothetical protein LZ31DRAFT_255066 [Colletotrichum somersetense]
MASKTKGSIFQPIFCRLKDLLTVSLMETFLEPRESMSEDEPKTHSFWRVSSLKLTRRLHLPQQKTAQTKGAFVLPKDLDQAAGIGGTPPFRGGKDNTKADRFRLAQVALHLLCRAPLGFCCLPPPRIHHHSHQKLRLQDCRGSPDTSALFHVPLSPDDANKKGSTTPKSQCCLLPSLTPPPS